MLIENKPIPDKWIHKKSFLKILKKALRSEEDIDLCDCINTIRDGVDEGFALHIIFTEQQRKEYEEDCNYRVFYQNIMGPEFLEEEKMFTDPDKHGTYKDDIIDLSSFETEYTPEAIEFFKNQTEFKFNQ